MSGRPKTGLSLAVLLILSACSLPESRLRTGLTEAGLSPSMARCMAGRMVDRLSLTQLRRIGDLKQAGRAGSIDEFLHRVRSLRDPEILTVTSSAAAICAVWRRR